MSKQKIILFVGLVLLAFSCAEVIELKNDSEGGQLVIFGRITNGGMGNQVDITRTLPEGQDPERVSGAMVKVIDSNGGEEQYAETSPGVYELARNIVQGQVGGTYNLVVELDGKTYTSAVQEMMPILAQDELRFELDIQDDITSSGVAISSDVVRVFANFIIAIFNFLLRFSQSSCDPRMVNCLIIFQAKF